MLADPLRVALEVTSFLVELEVPYYVGGSVASSLLGEPRSTNDVDLVADLDVERTPLLIARLSRAYYVDGLAARAAVEERGSFNVIHLETVLKVDLFVSPDDPFHRSMMERRRPVAVTELDALDLPSPEDLVLQKLDWYRQGGGVSDRQLRDVLGVLKVQASALDLGYLESWSRRLGIEGLLVEALGKAGLGPS